MKVEDWIKQASAQLANVGIGSARLDSLILLEDCLHKDRAYLLAHPELTLTTSQVKKLNKQITTRKTHVPLAYIRGFTEFYGRRFKVNPHVLEPRVESEPMIEILTKLKLPAKVKIADIGTGCGAIGITAALELNDAIVDLYDIDSSCLAVAPHNCDLHEVHLRAYKRDLLSRPVRNYDVILANLPYVPNRWKINEAAAMEPRIAIFGGKDGLDLYRRMFEQIKKIGVKPQFVFTESLPPMHFKLKDIAAHAGYKLARTNDFIQLFKA